MYYSYHNKIKQRINNGELIDAELVDKHNKISPCLLLRFSTKPYVKPIRESKFLEYQILLTDKLCNNSAENFSSMTHTITTISITHNGKEYK